MIVVAAIEVRVSPRLMALCATITDTPDKAVTKTENNG
jgi:hypothetical protein